MLDREELFERKSIPNAILTLAAPTVLGMLITVIYNIADTYFVGQTNNADMVAAVSLCLPVFFLLMGLGNIFGTGGGSYISRLLGQKDLERVRRVSAFSFYTCAAVGIVCLGVFLLLLEPILLLMGASPATLSYASDYMFVISLGAPFVMLQYALGQMIRAEGQARTAMIGMAIGSVINIALDPLMITTFAWGATGAAIATVVGNVCTVLFYVIFLLKRPTVLSLSVREYRPDKSLVGAVLKIGVPSSISTVLICVANTFLNKMASGFSDTAVAGIGIASRIAHVVRQLLIGLGQGTSPFIGYNFAAKNYRRMHGAMRFSGLLGVIFGSVCCVVLIVFAEPLVGVFIDNDAVIKCGAQMLKIFALSLPFLMLFFLFMGAFMAQGRSVPSLILAVFRDAVAYIPSLYLFRMLIQGVEGLAWAQPLSDAISTVLAAVIYIVIYQKTKKSMGLTQPLSAKYTQ